MRISLINRAIVSIAVIVLGLFPAVYAQSTEQAQIEDIRRRIAALEQHLQELAALRAELSVREARYKETLGPSRGLA